MTFKRDFSALDFSKKRRYKGIEFCAFSLNFIGSTHTIFFVALTKGVCVEFKADNICGVYFHVKRTQHSINEKCT